MIIHDRLRKLKAMAAKNSGAAPAEREMALGLIKKYDFAEGGRRRFRNHSITVHRDWGGWRVTVKPIARQWSGERFQSPQEALEAGKEKVRSWT